MKLILEQKQKLTMVMTNELRQAIELLQLSSYELYQFVQEKAAENPFIELIEKEDHDTPSYKSQVTSNAMDGETDFINNIATKEKNMYDALMEQIMHKNLQDDEKDIIEYIVLNLNEDGFTMVTDEEICENLQVGIHQVEAARSVIQTLEPCGIGARNLAESLTLQAKEYYPKNELLQLIINEHLEDLANKRWRNISNVLGCSLDWVQEAFEKLQTLSPRPAMEFSSTRVEFVQPDITINYDKEKALHTIQLHDHYIPHIQFNKEYSTQLKEVNGLSNYVQRQYSQFEWLQQSIEQRRQTILKVLNVIIRRQDAFLRKGLRYVQPLTLKEVADDIGMHESTVSRATANKVVQTPVGLMELRQFFSTKIPSNNGAASSQTEVKEIIKELISEEDTFKPLSDQKIADTIKAEYDIAISRRTVAKYRDELFILSSSKRKEVKV